MLGTSQSILHLKGMSESQNHSYPNVAFLPEKTRVFVNFEHFIYLIIFWQNVAGILIRLSS